MFELAFLLLIYFFAGPVHALKSRVQKTPDEVQILSFLLDGKVQDLGTGCLVDVYASQEVTRGFESCVALASQEEESLFVLRNSATLCVVARNASDDCPVGEEPETIYHVLPEKSPSPYDSSTPPGSVVATVSATVLKVNSFDISSQTYSFSMYLRHEWNDKRLQWHEEHFSGTSSITQTREFNSIWSPDSFLSWSVDVEHEDDEQFTTISSTGDVLQSKRLYVTAFCEMKFQYYPFERISCYSDVESYGMSAEELRYVLPAENSGFKSVIIDNQCGNGSFCGQVDKAGAYHIDKFVSAEVIEKSFGNRRFNAVRWTFNFEREWVSYIYTSFLSLWLITLLSIASCWVDHEDANTRLALGITTLLVMITELASFRQDLPQVTYLTAMDFYFFLTFAVGVTNIVECVILHRAVLKLGSQKTAAQCRTEYYEGEKSEGTEGGVDENGSNHEGEGAIDGLCCFGSEGRTSRAARSAHRFFRERPRDTLATEDEKCIAMNDIGACLVYLGIPAGDAVKLAKRMKESIRTTQGGTAPDAEGYVSEDDFARAATEVGLFKTFGNHGSAYWCGTGRVTAADVRVWDTFWRRSVLVLYLGFNIIWFAWVGASR